MWLLVELWHKVVDFIQLDCILVVLCFLLITNLRDLTEARIPNENGKRPLSAYPALILRLGQNVPLPATLDQILKTQLACYDQFFLLDVLDLALDFVHAF
jgi:hypothetical protein